MARVSATASLGVRKGLGGKVGWGSHDAASPHHSLTIEREVDNDLSDDQLVEKALEMHGKVEKAVSSIMNTEMQRIKEMP